ncbi:NAD(P)-dependent oxidoreductase [Nitrospirillum pindoramense]|uniref:Glutamate synthase (NADPH/NADH) small chain n=1 Tax=Nitrospirillum amazonense TaxID=28077 RepID=A0A560HLD2_9PROT|nr:NAD(P)-dependent oxidoreductase [Nitrospirillum amazonense]TWB46134.1 glutamate synthase (NADPH/NADH) small chain [Nitrospirillum amazonense]
MSGVNGAAHGNQLSLDRDLVPPFTALQAMAESSRCLYCYEAACVTACPTAIDIPGFIRKIGTGNVKGAARTILDANIMGGTCARACPTEVLCEQACVRNKAEAEPVAIGRLQRYATDALFKAGVQPFTRQAPTGKHVAVVGGGPAGLACAHRLALLGHEVTVFEARAKAGGLNEYGLAAYKMVGDFAQREVDFILSLGGISVKTGMALGRDVTLAQLRQDFDAVFLGVGLAGINTLGVAGEDLAGVADAVDVIAALRQRTAPPVAVAGPLAGRRVVVIGGGNTAVDAAIQSLCAGAAEVTMAYRRGTAEMGATGHEQDLARTQGVVLRTWLAPREILGAGGAVSGIVLERMAMDAGRLVGTGETVTIPCDVVLKAVGQKLAPGGLDGLALAGGRIQVDETLATSLPGVYAGGDCIKSGEDLTVQSVADGKAAAFAIDAYLKA